MKTLNVLNIKEDDILTRSDMKNIMAGSGSNGSGNCRIAWRNADNSFSHYSSNCLSYEVASDMYNTGSYNNDSQEYVSGYCCSSCGGSGFSNADPC